ncbi:MAG: hypothetical protein HY364_01840 [Candidatus Aenigmarchaeota archaeon]|nr:hypothetical protein [Candidatus Aenigmarchaeota archaeon]
MTTYREVSVIRPNIQQEYGSFKIYDEGRILIADGGGFGKTQQAIGAIRLIEIGTGRMPKTLAVVPNSGLEYWKSQLGTNYPRLRTTLLNDYGTRSLDRVVLDSDAIIVNHDVFGVKTTRDKVTQALENFKPDYVIVDEEHHTGDPKTHRYNMRRLTDRAKYLALLTATPVPDGMSDMFNLISMLEPENYPTPWHVARAYQKNPLVLGSVLNRKMLRRGDVELPEISTCFVEMNPDHAAVYAAVLAYEDISPTEKLDQLRKASLDPSLVEPDMITDPVLREKLNDIESSKYLELDRLVGNAIANGEKCVVFSSRFVNGVTRKLEERYKKHKALRIDGSVPTGRMGKESEREIVRHLFENSPEHCVLISNPHTMGESLPLVAASQEFLLDLPYSYGPLYQMTKRIDRRGQEKPVRITQLVVNYPMHPRGSIDAGINHLVSDKKRIIDIAMRGGRVKLEDGKLVSDSPVHTKRPILDVIYTPAQHVRRILTVMAGRSAESNERLIYANDGRTASDFADYYMHNWPMSYSGKTAQVYKRIIEGLQGSGEKISRILDAPSGPAILSMAMGIPTVSLDINIANFEKAKIMGAHPDNEYHKGYLHALPFTNDEFDLVLCSLGLNHTELERTDMTGRIIREREMSIKEQNRVSRKRAFNIQALPAYLDLDLDKLYAGMKLAGFEVIPELSGKVMATEPKDSKFSVYVITSRKYTDPVLEIPKEYFEFNVDRNVMESKRGKRKPDASIDGQTNHEICTQFAFQHESGLDDLQDTVSRYLFTNLRTNMKTILESLPATTIDGNEYITITMPRNMTLYEPKAVVEDLLLRLLMNHTNATRRELRKSDNELYQEFRRLNLLHLIPER